MIGVVICTGWGLGVCWWSGDKSGQITYPATESRDGLVTEK